MNDDLTLKSHETLTKENEIVEERVVIRKKPNLLYAKLAGYAIPLVVVAIAIFWVIPLKIISKYMTTTKFFF